MHKLNPANPASRSRIRTLLRKQECQLLSALAPHAPIRIPFRLRRNSVIHFCHPNLRSGACKRRFDDDGKPFAALHGLRRRGAGAMSLFPGGSAQPEPLLGLPGASSHLQATVPTLLQALSASESTAPPRGPKKQARCRQRLLAGRAGWPQARAAGAWCGAGHGSQLAEASSKLAMDTAGKAAAAGAHQPWLP